MLPMQRPWQDFLAFSFLGWTIIESVKLLDVFKKTVFLPVVPTLLLFCQVVPACQYNVRDVGFSDLGFHSYRLLLFTDEQVEQARLEEMEGLSLAQLLESNIRPETVRMDRPEDKDLFRFLPVDLGKALPALVLIAPDERVRLLASSERLNIEDNSFWDVLEGVRSSPAREALLDALVRSYCVLIMVEGLNDAENEEVHKILNETIEEAIHLMGHLPKSVAYPPRKITVERERLEEESLLLWSLGCLDFSPEEDRFPAVAVVYGRGRLLDSPLLGAQIGRGTLLRLMSFVGQDCECDLDRDWILGRSLPLAWTPEHRSHATKLLGFDPENPMVRAEMRRILSSGLASTRHLDASYEGAQGYTEVVIEWDEDGEDLSSLAQPTSAESSVKPEEEEGDAWTNPGKGVQIVAGGLSLSLLLGGGIILLVSRRRLR